MEMAYGDEATRRLHQEGLSYGKGFASYRVPTPRGACVTRCSHRVFPRRCARP